MSKKDNFKENVQLLKLINTDNGFLDDEYVDLKNIFSKDEITSLIDKNILKPYKIVQCLSCRNKLTKLDKKELELYDFYFSLNNKKDKNIKDLEIITSVEEILSLKLNCKHCGDEYRINEKYDIDILLKNDVYKITLNNA